MACATQRVDAGVAAVTLALKASDDHQQFVQAHASHEPGHAAVHTTDRLVRLVATVDAARA